MSFTSICIVQVDVSTGLKEAAMEGSDPAGQRYAASGCRESNFEEAIAGAMAAGLRGDRGERRETCLVICEPNFHESRC
jgi:hypothetical protein